MERIDDFRFREVRTGMSIDDYKKSEWAIPGDGHPTPDGHDYFAAILAKEITADLR